MGLSPALDAASFVALLERVARKAVEEEAPALSPEEETGSEAARESHRQGRVVDGKRAREIIDAALER